MSMSITRARALAGYHPMVNPGGYRGDPGLFSFLGGLIKGGANLVSKVAGIVPGVGTAVSEVSGLIGGLIPASGPSMTKGKQAVQKSSGARMMAMGGAAPPISIAKLGLQRGNLTQSGSSGTDPVTGLPVPLGGRSGPVTGANIRGHHLNRSAYTLKDGTRVEKGTKLVTNRRRNPGNPRALHRAVSRMVSFEHMASRVNKSLAKVARKAVRRGSAPRASGHRAGCGCVVCKRR